MTKLITRNALTSILTKVKGINEDKEVFTRYGNNDMCLELNKLSESLMEIYQFVSFGVIDGSFRFHSTGETLPVMNDEYVLTRPTLDDLMEVLGMLVVKEIVEAEEKEEVVKKPKPTSKVFTESKKRQDEGRYKTPRIMDDSDDFSDVTSDIEARVSAVRERLKKITASQKPVILNKNTDTTTLAAVMLGFYPDAEVRDLLDHTILPSNSLSMSNVTHARSLQSDIRKQFFRVICALPRLSKAVTMVKYTHRASTMDKYALVLANYDEDTTSYGNAAKLTKLLRSRGKIVRSMVRTTASGHYTAIGTTAGVSKMYQNLYFKGDDRSKGMEDIFAALELYFYGNMSIAAGINFIETLTETNTLGNYRVTDRHVASLMENYQRRAEDLRGMYEIVNSETPEKLKEFTKSVRKSLILESILRSDPELAAYNKF